MKNGNPPNKVDRAIATAKKQATKTRRQVVITVVINPDAPDQIFTGTIAGRFDIVYADS